MTTPDTIQVPRELLERLVGHARTIKSMLVFENAREDRADLDEVRDDLRAVEALLNTEPAEKCIVCGGDEPCSHDFDRLAWPAPATSPTLITCETPPVFPCELWPAFNGEWHKYESAPYKEIGSDYQIKCWPYWRSLKPIAPNVAPRQKKPECCTKSEWDEIQSSEAHANQPNGLPGQLTHAGTMNVGEDTDVTGFFVTCTVEELRAIHRLPMYKRVRIIPEDEASK